jgi:hypothetical protein
MGHVHEQHGKIAIETRGDTGFIIHAGYGFQPGRKPIGELKPGATFIASRSSSDEEPRAWKLRGLFESHAEATCQQTSATAHFKLTDRVEVPGTEEFVDDAALAKAWNGEDARGHPEFLREDLDDLIAALVEVRDRS